MAACSRCHREFAGTPWRYADDGTRIHTNCEDAEFHNVPIPPRETRRHISEDERRQSRWRQIAHTHAHWSKFARHIVNQPQRISPAQGAVLDKIERNAR
jgi:hypothetical protein